MSWKAKYVPMFEDEKAKLARIKKKEVSKVSYKDRQKCRQLTDFMGKTEGDKNEGT